MEPLRRWVPRPVVSVAAGQDAGSAAGPVSPVPVTVTPVKLSDLARRKPDVRPAEPRDAAVPADSRQERLLRRNGFEVARGMITAAVKSELASCRSRGGSAGAEELEARILNRISQIQAPFVA